LEWWNKYVPSIDIYGLNSYGPGAAYLPVEMKKKGIDKPYIITEFGVTGEWDIEEKINGIVVEPTDQQKYDAIAKGYPDWIKSKGSCLGVYVFHYGNDTSFGSVWLLSHHDSMTRPTYWAIREAFTGQKPNNYIPEIITFELMEAKAQSGTWVPVSLKANDHEKEKLNVSFYYNQRTGSRKRRNQVKPLNFRGNQTDGFEIQIPKEDGAIKVYVAINDTYKNVGIASTTIIAVDQNAKDKKYLVPKAKLPFYVYKENEKTPYFPSAYMGNYKDIEVDLNHPDNVYSGSSCIKISYKAESEWYGVGFVDPPNDWGDILGGYDITGAKKLSFWTKTNGFNVEATIGYGLIEKDKPFPDTSKKSIKVKLTQEWKKYEIKLTKADLSCIRSGFVIFSSSNGFPHDIYIDNIVYE
jgi:hypothetical protein